MVTKYTSTYMIDRKKTQYVILYVNHNIGLPSIAMGPKSFSAVIWMTSGAE